MSLPETISVPDLIPAASELVPAFRTTAGDPPSHGPVDPEYDGEDEENGEDPELDQHGWNWGAKPAPEPGTGEETEEKN